MIKGLLVDNTNVIMNYDKNHRSISDDLEQMLYCRILHARRPRAFPKEKFPIHQGRRGRHFVAETIMRST